MLPIGDRIRIGAIRASYFVANTSARAPTPQHTHYEYCGGTHSVREVGTEVSELLAKARRNNAGGEKWAFARSVEIRAGFYTSSVRLLELQTQSYYYADKRSTTSTTDHFVLHYPV